MEPAGINYLAVLVSAVAYMIIGALWYSPILFGNAWMKGIGKTKEEITAQSAAWKYIWALAMSFIAAYGIARIMLWTGGNSITDALLIAILAGICFILTTFTVNDNFEGRPMGLSFINVFYHVVGFIVMGIIIGAWR
jgi:hypothetical protein